MASRLPWGWVLAMVCMPSFTQAEISGDLRICVLRVNFIEDTKESTTGNGQFLSASEGIDCVSYQVDPPPHDKSYFEYAGASGGYIDFLGYPYCRGRIFDSLEEDIEQYN